MENFFCKKGMFFPVQVSATFAQPPGKRTKKPSAPVSAEHLISVATSHLQKEDDEFFYYGLRLHCKNEKN